MASYLFQHVPQSIQPYNHPLQLFQQSLMIKDEKFKSGLSAIRSKYDSILSLPLTNEQDQATLKNNLDTAMQTLNKTAVSDVSLPENQATINGVLDNVLNDGDLMYDAAWTRNHRNELTKAQDLEKKSPELVAPQNLEPLYLAQEQFRSAPKGSRPKPVQFSPYYDYNKKMNDDLDKIKADVERVFSVQTNQVEGPDGQMHSVSSPLQYTVKQLKDYKVQQLAWSRINSDAQTLNQMSLDYNYNTKNGLYPPQAALSGIDQEIGTYQNLSKSLATALNTGTGLDNKSLDANSRDSYESRQKNVNSEIQRLQGLKNDINLDPNKAGQWFSFNKYIKDYVEGKVSQYTNREDSLISSVPGLDKLTDYQLDVWKEQWKSNLKIQEDASKTKAKEADFVPTPYKDLVYKLSDSPAGIPATNQELAGLGQMNVDKDGNMFMNWTGDSKTAGSTLIFKPGSGSFTKDQVSSIDSGIIIKKMTQELENLNIKVPGGSTSKIPLNFGPDVIPGGGGLDIHATYSGSDILDAYTKNPGVVDPRVKAIIDNYQTVLSKYNIDLKDTSSIKNVQAKLKDPDIQKAIDFGSTINLNGNFQFTADPDNNLILGDNGKLYMSGKFIVPEYKVLDAVGNKGGSYVKNFIKEWDVVKGIGDPGDKSKPINNRLYGVHVYVPVNGDVTQINDRLLDTQGYQNQWGKDAPQFREKSRQETVKFQDIVQRSGALGSINLPYRQNQQGNYNVDFNTRELTSDQRNSLSQSSSIAQSISTLTGQDYNTVNQQVDNIFGSTSNPIRRTELLDQLKSSSITQNGFRSFPNYEAGRAALENQLNLYKTGQTSNPVGPSSTLLQAMSVYAPSSDGNNPRAYAQRIADALGISINTPISQIDVKKWADVVEQVEGNKSGNNPGNLRP